MDEFDFPPIVDEPADEEDIVSDDDNNPEGYLENSSLEGSDSDDFLNTSSNFVASVLNSSYAESFLNSNQNSNASSLNTSFSSSLNSSFDSSGSGEVGTLKVELSHPGEDPFDPSYSGRISIGEEVLKISPEKTEQEKIDEWLKENEKWMKDYGPSDLNEEMNLVDYDPQFSESSDLSSWIRVIDRSNPKKMVPFQVSLNDPVLKVLLGAISFIEKEQVGSRSVVFRLDSKNAVPEEIGESDTFLEYIQSTETTRNFYYTLEKNPEAPRVSAPRPKRKLTGEDKLNIVRSVMTVMKGKTKSKAYQEAREWIYDNASSNWAIYYGISGYLDKIRGRDDWSALGAAQVERWLEEALTFPRHAAAKSREKKDPNDVTLIKIKYDPVTNSAEVKETKHAKRLKKIAKKTILEFEKSYPDYFTSSYFKKAKRKLDQFALKDYDEDEEPRHKKLGEIKRHIKKLEDEDMDQKMDLVFAFFILNPEETFTKKQVYDFWKTLYEKMTKPTKMLIDEMLEDSSMFDKTENPVRYRLSNSMWVQLSHDPVFQDTLDYMKVVVFGKEPVEKEEEETEDSDSDSDSDDSSVSESSIEGSEDDYDDSASFSDSEDDERQETVFEVQVDESSPTAIEVNLMEKMYGLEPGSLKRLNIPKISKEYGIEKLVEEIFETLLPDPREYTMEKTGNVLIANFLSNLRESRLKKLQNNFTLKTAIRVLLLSYAAQGKDPLDSLEEPDIREKLRKSIINAYRVTPNQTLKTLSSKSLIKKLSDMNAYLAQKNLGTDYWSFKEEKNGAERFVISTKNGNLSEEQAKRVQEFLAWKMPDRVETIHAFVVLSTSDKKDAVKDIIGIVSAWNKTEDGILPSPNEPSWGIRERSVGEYIALLKNDNAPKILLK